MARLASILVVDDDTNLRQNIHFIIEKGGMKSAMASSGEEALQRMRTTSFDLVLLDVQMPGMGGLEAARTIRSKAALNRDTPIVALSANVMADQIADCYAAGMNDHLAKPISPASLLSTVAKWTRPADADIEARAALA